MPKAKLTPKQDAFVKAYLLNGGNATQAAIDAGYSKNTASETGYENLSKPQIKEAIKKHQKEANKVFIWSKETKLLKLEAIVDNSIEIGEEGKMNNPTAAIAAMKEHNLMQGDNAPTETNSNINVSDTLASNNKPRYKSFQH